MNSSLRHALCILLLALFCLIVRVPSLDRIALNPDESQYEATASYLLATGASSYSLPYGTVTTFAMYKTMAAIFGPYCMFEVRVLVMLVVLAMAVMLYFLVGRATSWWCGLLGGIVFLHYNLSFEGLSANREWFAGFLILAGMLLFMVEDGRRRWLLAVAGLVAGCSLWFKMQAAFLLLPIPLVMAWQGLTARNVKQTCGRMAAYCGGVAAAITLYLGQFLVAGTLPTYMDSLVTRWNSYVVGNEAATGELPVHHFGLLFDKLLWDLPHRSLFIAVYIGAAVLGLALVRKDGRLRPRSAAPATLLMLFYLAAGLMAVKMGNLFFDHYYLFIMPPVAGLLGLTAHFFARIDRSAVLGRVAGITIIVLLLADRLSHIKAAYQAHAVIPLVYVVIAVALLGVIAWRPARLIPAVVVAMLWLETGALVIQSQSLKRPVSLPFHSHGYSELVERIDSQRGKGDSLFVWGWAPEIYSLTAMEAASHFSITQYVVNDYRIDPSEPELDGVFADMLMDDLKLRRPRFIVDAWRRSWTMEASNDPWIYRLDLYPQFELAAFLEENYSPAGRYDDCDLYVRR